MERRDRPDDPQILGGAIGLIEEFLPAYDVVTRHSVSIDAPRERIWDCMKNVDIGRSFAARTLFALRRLPAGSSGRAFPLTVDKLTLSGFIFLGERCNDEILFGLIGKPWSARYGARAIAPELFVPFSETGLAKIVWNFKIENGAPPFRLSTETRVRCLDDDSRRRFKLYWAFVWPFSGFIRMEMLRLIRECATSG